MHGRLGADGIDDARRRQGESVTRRQRQRGRQAHRYQHEVIVGSDRKVIGRHAHHEFERLAGGLRPQADGHQTAQELRDVAGRQLLSNQRLALIIGHGADLLCERLSSRRVRRPLRDALREGQRTCVSRGGRKCTRPEGEDQRNGCNDTRGLIPHHAP